MGRSFFSIYLERGSPWIGLFAALKKLTFYYNYYYKLYIHSLTWLDCDLLLSGKHTVRTKISAAERKPFCSHRTVAYVLTLWVTVKPPKKAPACVRDKASISRLQVPLICGLNPGHGVYLRPGFYSRFDGNAFQPSNLRVETFEPTPNLPWRHCVGTWTSSVREALYISTVYMDL